MSPPRDRRRFPPEQIEALFQAVLIDDDVDAITELPDRITFDHDAAVLADGFDICRQLWLDGVDRRELLALIDILARDRDLDADNRRRFKHMRAKLKHFRFACALYGERHRYPVLTDWLTTALGHLQDAFKTGQDGRVLEKVLVTRVLLSPLAWTLMRREQDRLVLTGAAGLRAYVARDMARLAEVVAHPTLTGAQFHAARKVASRQVSFYDTMRTVRPSDDAYRMSRTLAAINGLMGDLHDRLVERRVAGVQDYHREHFALPPEIHGRIAALVDRYRASGLAI